ncbi:protein CURLY FLAG LEAF 1-like isoform X1 [Mercurialis annua]|uniref:protein CURLY FLAG LEAF 1-like isoform X1 n=1 Tax=Mercurialis annua TaxID=3986 RepID=UPI002160B972|nr:protein CURLY FLAG LEAF 1-like isoform X1 [Mercurialis annua]
MELTELCLAPRKLVVEKLSRSSSESAECNNISKKRKLFSDHASVDLHVKDPLPLDWEQCLDLQSGRMYYLNRKTLRKSWNWPKDQKLDLELNISPLTDNNNYYNNNNNNSASKSIFLEEDLKENLSSPSSNMVALACLNCHLLVILSRSSPSCPNCKYVHSLPLITNQPPIPKISPTKSFNTLSLLN